MSIELSGIDEMLSNLDRMGVNIQEVKPKAIKAGAEIVRKAISNKARYGVKNQKTWQFKASKKYAVEHLKDNIIMSEIENDSVSVGPDKDFFYAHMLEYGTTKMRAQPFAEPAFIESKDKALEEIAKQIKEAIDKSV